MTTIIDMTPTWEESSRIFIALLENGDATGRATARTEVQRMGKIIDTMKAQAKAMEAFRPTLTQIFDPDHAWLVVTPAQLAAVGMTEADVSRGSYRRNDRIALEGDCDAPRFLTAYAVRFGHIPIIREEDESPRTWARFGTREYDPNTFAEGIDFDLINKLVTAAQEAAHVVA